MKVVELKKIIREEVRRVVKEMEVTPTTPTAPTTTATAKPVGMKQFLQKKIADPNIAKGLSPQENKAIQDLIDLMLTKGHGGDITAITTKVQGILANMTKAIK